MFDFGPMLGATYAVELSQYVRAGDRLTVQLPQALPRSCHQTTVKIIIHMTKHAGSAFPFNRRSGSSPPCGLSGLLLRPRTQFRTPSSDIRALEFSAIS